MKIRPVILCGGAGTRLFPNIKKRQVKQFIDFGGWTLFGKTLDRIKSSLFDDPIISTNAKYYKLIKRHLKRKKIHNYKIILEPHKKNTGPAIITAALVNYIPEKQPLIYLAADHLIENKRLFNDQIKKSKKNLNSKNIFIFGIKPNINSDQFGYFITKKKNKLNKEIKFIEKPSKLKAKKIIKKGGCWNSGIFLARKDSIINNYKTHQKMTYKASYLAISKSKLKRNTYFLNKKDFKKNPSLSFDYSILEKAKEINAVKLNLNWSDLGSWKEILLMFNKYRNKYLRKKNIFFRPWGKYINLFRGNNFLIKELNINPKGILSLQKHFYRSEHWVVTKGNPKITLNNKKFTKKPLETIFIPRGSIHRIQNTSKKVVKIMEVQLGSVLKETDIVRYEDVYGRVN